MAASLRILARFAAKFELLFDLKQENAFFEKLHFKANKESISSSKKRYYGSLK